MTNGQSLTFKWVTGVLLSLVLIMGVAWARTQDQRATNLELMNADRGERLARIEMLLSETNNRLARIEAQYDRRAR